MTRRPSILTVAVLAETVAVVALVARDGRPAWLLVRVALVAAAATITLRRARWFALAFGVVGSTAGAAVAIPHLVKAGVSVVAIAASLAVIAGTAVAGITAWRLVRTARGWRRWLALPIGFVVVQLGVLPLVGAVAATNVPPTALDDRTPADAGIDHEDVTFESSDGVDLSAWYVPSRNGAAVLLLHGSGSTRSAVLEHALVVADAGYGALLLDARGHGRSGGDAMDFGWYGDRDVAAAVDWLAARADVEGDRIALLGLSMGGEQAITYAAVDTRVRAVVAEGATQRVPDDAGWLPHTPTGWLRRGVERVLFGTADLLSSASSPIPLREALRRTAPRPVLLIASSAPDEIRADRWLRAAAPNSTELWELPDTPHTDALELHRTAWTRRVLQLLERSLGS